MFMWALKIQPWDAGACVSPTLLNDVMDMAKEEQKPKAQTPMDENTKYMRNVHNG